MVFTQLANGTGQNRTRAHGSLLTYITIADAIVNNFPPHILSVTQTDPFEMIHPSNLMTKEQQLTETALGFNKYWL